ncbi:MAG: Ser-Thr-rich GPI-anchored membrane family protein [Bacteroidota bacterium]
MQYRLLLCAMLFLCLKIAHSQDLQITSVNLVGDQVEVHYNLFDERIDRTYSVHLYTSNDNFIQPMEEVDGDVGIDIKVGENKVLTWNAKEELGSDFDKAISLELKGNYYIPFITIEGIEKGKIFKRGKPQDFTWSGGRGDNVLNFELYKGENLVKSFEEKPNIGNTTIVIPSSVKPGSGYQFKISDAKNRDEIVFSEPFTVKRKIPLGIKLGASFLIGAAAGYIITNVLDEQGSEQPDIPLPNVPEQ